MCLGSAERTGGRSDAVEEEADEEGAAAAAVEEDLGCLRMETGVVVLARVAGFEDLEGAKDAAVGTGAEFARV